MRRLLRLPWYVLVVWGVLLVTTAAVVALVASCATGTAVDRFRLTVVVELLVRLRFAARPAHARAMLAILWRESRGAAAPVVGDADLPGGPSVGPGQVYRATAKALGLWAPPPDVAGDDAWERAAYASVANDEDTCVRWAVAVFVQKLREAGGNVTDAVRRYNGGGAAADAYRDAVVSWADATWPGKGLA